MKLSARNVLKGKIVPIVIDWGVAKYIGRENLYNPPRPYFTAETYQGTGIHNRGTPPEVLAGLNPIAASDIYMLGYLMYFLFSGGNHPRLPATHADFVLHPRDINPDLPYSFNKMVEYMTQYEPADRIPSMDLVHKYLESLYLSTAILDYPADVPIHFYFYCEANEAAIPLVREQLIRIGRDEVIMCGERDEMDEILYSGLIPTQDATFQFELFLRDNVLFLRDFHSLAGSFIYNLTMEDGQIYNCIPLKGIDNAYIPLIPSNLQNSFIEVPVFRENQRFSIKFRIKSNLNE